MKNMTTQIVNPRPIKVESNGASGKNKWMRIRCASTNAILHTGQPQYIKAVARKKYSHKVVGV